MKIGLGQLNIIRENITENKKQCEKMIAAAQQQQVDFILFPEMTLTGFSVQLDTYGETLENSPSIDFFQSQAKKYHISIGFGMIIKNGEKAENHCMIVGPDGTILADYAKIHPFSYGTEAKFFTGGEKLVNCQIKNMTVSPLVCYDLRFPEIFQACSIQSSLITIIANWPAPRRGHWISLLKARAIENQCYIAGVNCCGTDGTSAFSGDSLIIDPYGEVIAHAKAASELIVADIDETLVLQARTDFPFQADRRPQFYSQFYPK